MKNIIVVNCSGGLVQDVGSLNEGVWVYVIDHDVIDDDKEAASEAVWDAECVTLDEWNTDSESALGRIAQAMKEDEGIQRHVALTDIVNGTYTRGTPVPEAIREAWATLNLGEFPTCLAQARSHVVGDTLADYLVMEWQESEEGDLTENATSHMIDVVEKAIMDLETFAESLHRLQG